MLGDQYRLRDPVMNGSSNLDAEARPRPVTDPQGIDVHIEFGKQDQPAVILQHSLQLVEQLCLPVASLLFQLPDQHHEIRRQLTVLGARRHTLP